MLVSVWEEVGFGVFLMVVGVTLTGHTCMSSCRNSCSSRFGKVHEGGASVRSYVGGVSGMVIG